MLQKYTKSLYLKVWSDFSFRFMKSRNIDLVYVSQILQMVVNAWIIDAWHARSCRFFAATAGAMSYELWAMSRQDKGATGHPRMPRLCLTKYKVSYIYIITAKIFKKGPRETYTYSCTSTQIPRRLTFFCFLIVCKKRRLSKKDFQCQVVCSCTMKHGLWMPSGSRKLNGPENTSCSA